MRLSGLAAAEHERVRLGVLLASLDEDLAASKAADPLPPLPLVRVAGEDVEQLVNLVEVNLLPAYSGTLSSLPCSVFLGLASGLSFLVGLSSHVGAWLDEGQSPGRSVLKAVLFPAEGSPSQSLTEDSFPRVGPLVPKSSQLFSDAAGGAASTTS